MERERERKQENNAHLNNVTEIQPIWTFHKF